MKKAMKAVIAVMLAVSVLAGMRMFAVEQPSVAFNATKAADGGIDLSFTIKNTEFNAAQFILSYNTGKLSLESDAVTFHAPRFDGEEGWMSSVVDFTTAPGIAHLLVYVDSNSWGAPNGASSEGFAVASSDGLLIATLHFKIKGNAVITTNDISIQETTTMAGVVLSVPDGDTVKGLEGIAETRAVFDLSNVAVPGENSNSGEESTNPSEETSAVFKDVPADFWAKDSIENLAELGIISGYPDGTFAPNRQLTRAEFAKTLVMALGLEESSATTPFKDVGTGHWAKGFIATVYEAGYVNGKSADTFAPDANITREEMATIIARAKGYTASGTGSFTDVSSISDWAVQSVVAAAQAGIIRGYEDGSFKPQNNVTRTEMAVMIERMLKA